MTYPVKGRWPENLWKARKLTHEKYEAYLFACRDGVLPRRRNLDACKEEEAAAAAQAEMEERVKRIRGNAALFTPFPAVPAAQAWLDLFKADRLRYPLLVVVGASQSGKTEWAKTLFRNALEIKIGALEVFPDSMRLFSRAAHDGLILDDVRDLQFLVNHQEKLQGKYDCLVEFASTPGGALSYKKDLFAIPIVVTANETTRNLNYLETNDFLGHAGNRVVVNFPLVPAQGDGGPLCKCRTLR
jgi:hypothetical protein